MTTNPEITIIAPARICLFGDHQDYLDLPVIACAINRFIELNATRNDTNILDIEMPDIDKRERIVLPLSQSSDHQGNHLKAAIKLLENKNIKINQGYHIVIRGNIAINAGTSSSSAVVVAFIKFLLEAFSDNQATTPQMIAELAYQAEVAMHGNPGGRMDQYSIGLGNVMYLETYPELRYELLSLPIPGLIVGESGIPKPTIGLLQELKDKAKKAVERIKSVNPGFQIQNVEKAKLPNYLDLLPIELHPYFSAAVKNYDVTKRAKAELAMEKPSIKYLGHLMSEHHNILKTYLQITVPRIDDMIDAAIEAGAWGAKIVGSGKGGSIAVISPPNREERIIKAIIEAGARDAYSVEVDSGVRVVKSRYFQ